MKISVPWYVTSRILIERIKVPVFLPPSSALSTHSLDGADFSETSVPLYQFIRRYRFQPSGRESSLHLSSVTEVSKTLAASFFSTVQ